MNTINKNCDYFKTLILDCDSKSRRKTYKNFICLLSDLKNKNLTEEEIQAIETELDILGFESHGEFKTNKRKIEKFKKFLKDNFSLIPEGYYTSLGIALGLCFGVAFGTSIFSASMGTSIGLSIGMVIGLVIGKKMDAKAEKENRVLYVVC